MREDERLRHATLRRVRPIVPSADSEVEATAVRFRRPGIFLYFARFPISHAHRYSQNAYIYNGIDSNTEVEYPRILQFNNYNVD